MKITACSPLRSVYSCALLALLTLVSGCVAGPGSVTHQRGDLDTTLAAGVAAAARAAQITVVQMGYTPISERQSDSHAILIVRQGTDQRLEIYLQKTHDGTTGIKIRTTPPGHESVQQEVLSMVRANL